MQTILIGDLLRCVLRSEQREMVQLGFWPADLCMTPGWTYTDFPPRTLAQIAASVPTSFDKDDVTAV
jgi:hypothetical protein